MDWFISDTHFGHQNIIKYCNRPFADTVVMDDSIINNINSCVASGDTLWHLGDFCFGKGNATAFVETTKAYRQRINCENVNLIWGNHDPRYFSKSAREVAKTEGFRQLFKVCMSREQIEVDGIVVDMCHYPKFMDEDVDEQIVYLHGHCHGTLTYKNPRIIHMDVGVDCTNFMPLTLNQIIKEIQIGNSKVHTI